MSKLRDRLHDVWLTKKEYLEDLYNQQMFLRDISQLETLSNTQQVGACQIRNKLHLDIIVILIVIISGFTKGKLSPSFRKGS